MGEAAGTDACRGWDNSDCRGSPYCPPRCPRYFDKTGAPVLIRPIRAGDKPSLVRMYENLSPHQRSMGVPPLSPDAIDLWIDSLIQAGWNLVALLDNRLVGHVAVAPTPAVEPEFIVFVDDDYHDRGIGTELLRQMVAYAADANYDAIRLDVSWDNPGAIRLYQNIGFERHTESGAGTPDGLHVKMRLTFPHPLAERVRLPPAER